MAYRIVKINNRCKLETKLNYLVCRSDKESRILLDDIDILVIESQQVCITSALISELMNHKVRVIFCDSYHDPQGELNPYFGCYDSYAKINKQIQWEQNIKDVCWKKIIIQKVSNQAYVLNWFKCVDAYNSLRNYLVDIDLGDSTNREGLAAKVYFSTLFGASFDRRNKKDFRNICLNYGYALILSAINREIASFGYLNQLGIHHRGETNPFNLGCDLMEPFRPFVDYIILKETLDEDNYKKKLLEVLVMEVLCGERIMLVENAIHDYVLSFFSYINQQSISPIIKIAFKNE